VYNLQVESVLHVPVIRKSQANIPTESEESSVTKRSHIVEDASQQVENVTDLEAIFDMCRLSLESISILVSSD